MAVHDCCDEADQTPDGGQPCKPGQPCPLLAKLFPMTSLSVAAQEPAPATVFPRVTEAVSSFDPAATWRPPAQL